MLANWSEDVKMRLVGGFADLMGGEFKGHDGIRRWFDEWVESLDVRAEIESIDEVDDRVVVIARVAGAGGASGTPVTLRGGQIYSFRDGRISEVANYYDPTEALEAVGLAG